MVSEWVTVICGLLLCRAEKLQLEVMVYKLGEEFWEAFRAHGQEMLENALRRAGGIMKEDMAFMREVSSNKNLVWYETAPLSESPEDLKGSNKEE